MFGSINAYRHGVHHRTVEHPRFRKKIINKIIGQELAQWQKKKLTREELDAAGLDCIEIDWDKPAEINCVVPTLQRKKTSPFPHLV